MWWGYFNVIRTKLFSENSIYSIFISNPIFYPIGKLPSLKDSVFPKLSKNQDFLTLTLVQVPKGPTIKSQID